MWQGTPLHAARTVSNASCILHMLVCHASLDCPQPLEGDHVITAVITSLHCWSESLDVSSDTLAGSIMALECICKCLCYNYHQTLAVADCFHHEPPGLLAYFICHCVIYDRKVLWLQCG